MSAESPTLDDHIRWICKTSIDDGKSHIKAMIKDRGKRYTDDQIRQALEAAQAYEIHTGHRKSLIVALRSAIKQVTPKPVTSIIQNPKSSASDVEVVTEAEVNAAELSGLAESISRSREIIYKHEQSCHETTLEHYLEAGMHLARAQEIFTLSIKDRTGPATAARTTLSTVDNVDKTSPEILAIRGFSAWLAAALPDLKRPTAIRYATAFRALELPVTAKPADIKAKLKTLRHQAGKASLPMPTLAALVKQAPKLPEPENLTVVIPKSSKQLKLEDARETYHLWMETWDKALKHGHLEHLDKKGLEQLKDFTATVRDRINARLK